MSVSWTLSLGLGPLLNIPNAKKIIKEAWFFSGDVGFLLELYKSFFLSCYKQGVD